jgi:hypothetical protein
MGGRVVVKLFTIDEATELLPVVDAHVDTMQSAARDATELRQAAVRTRTGSVDARNLVQEIAFVVGQAHDAKAELDRLGVVITDLEHGQVAFPAQLGGELVSLTWRRGEDAITHYRRLADDGDPLPVDDRHRSDSRGR